MIKKYFLVWWILANNSFQTQLNIRWGLLIFLIAKILRFAVFIIFIFILVKQTKLLAGYNLEQMVLFFLSFNLVDMLAQLLLREVYRFRSQIILGNFDFYLLKPVNPLFRALFGGPDLIDFTTLIPLVISILYIINQMGLFNLPSLMIYFFMISIGFIIALSFHILVLSLAVVTTEIDNALMLYRDIMSMGKMPIDIYKEPIRSLLTFIIPVGIAMSFPAKALLGLLSVQMIFYALIFAMVIFLLSLKSWQYALKNYSSASS